MLTLRANLQKIRRQKYLIWKITLNYLKATMKGNIFKGAYHFRISPLTRSDHRGASRTATASGMELFVAIVNSFYQWTIVTKTLVLDVETVLSPPWTPKA